MVMAEIGGPLAHQLNPLQSHRGGLVQPSLVMNHHLDPLDNGGGTCLAPNIHPSKCTRERKCSMALADLLRGNE